MNEHDQALNEAVRAGTAIARIVEGALSRLNPEDAITAIAGGLASSVEDLEDGELEYVLAAIKPCEVAGCDCHNRIQETIRLLMKLRLYSRKTRRENAARN